MIQKLVTILRRDGIVHTSKRLYAYAVAHSPWRLRASFTYQPGLRLLFAPTLLTYSLFATRTARQGDADIIRQYLAPGDTMIDVGSNIGSLTLVAAQAVGATGTVLAFEPAPTFADITRRNVAHNQFSDRVTVHQVAVGDSCDTVHLNEAVADDTTSHISATGTAVPQAPLDTYTTDLPTIAFLKIDVEGYDQAVLAGATNTLQKTKVVYTEHRPPDIVRCGGDPAAVLDMLQQYFHLYTIAGNTLVPYTGSTSAPADYPDLLGFNKSAPLPHTVTAA